MKTWVYVLDVFKPVKLDVEKLFSLVESSPLKLFNLIRETLKEDLGEIVNVKVFDIYFNPKTFDLLVEYIVNCSFGEVSVKFIYSDNPRQTLYNYYKYETEKRKRSLSVT